MNISGCGATSSATCSLNGAGEYRRERTEEWQGDMLWEHGIADFVKRLNQSVLAVRLERNVKIDCRVIGGG